MTDLLDPLPPTAAPRSRENTRSRIVRASLTVFVEKGIDGATIDDLVTAAGFTRGAFYSSFSKKEEVFNELFTSVTDEVVRTVRESVEHAVASKVSITDGGPDGDRAAVMVDIFEAIRPYGRQWYLLYSESVAHALRSEEALAQLNAQRIRLRDEIAAAIANGLTVQEARSIIPVEQLAQLLIGVFVDLMVQENLDGADITDLAGTTILKVMHGFVVPRDS